MCRGASEQLPAMRNQVGAGHKFLKAMQDLRQTLPLGAMGRLAVRIHATAYTDGSWFYPRFCHTSIQRPFHIQSRCKPEDDHHSTHECGGSRIHPSAIHSHISQASSHAVMASRCQ